MSKPQGWKAPSAGRPGKAAAAQWFPAEKLEFYDKVASTGLLLDAQVHLIYCLIGVWDAEYRQSPVAGFAALAAGILNIVRLRAKKRGMWSWISAGMNLAALGVLTVSSTTADMWIMMLGATALSFIRWRG